MSVHPVSFANAEARLRHIPMRRVLILTDQTVYEHHARRIHQSLRAESVELLCLPEREEGKRMEVFYEVLCAMDRARIGRSDYVVAIGGGAVTDVAGLAAAIYKRGVRLINIPTTLLGMIDAAIGGKSGINWGTGKNMLGTTRMPDDVIIDIDLLETLPERIFREGLAEAIKHAVIGDPNHFLWLEGLADPALFSREMLCQLIQTSIEIKMDHVVLDPDDTQGTRALLNFGHTFGHAIEKLSNFSVPHGYAVAVGMVMASQYAKARKHEDITPRLVRLLARAKLPTSLQELSLDTSAEDFYQAMLGDKKEHGGKIRLVVPYRLGTCVLEETDPDDLQWFLLQHVA